MSHALYQGHAERRAAQACCTATGNYAAVIGVYSMPQISATIWYQRRPMVFISRLLGGQSITSTSWLSRMKLSWKLALVQRKALLQHSMYICLFMAPFSTTSPLLSPRWIPAHTMIDGPTLSSVSWTHQYASHPAVYAPGHVHMQL